MIGDLGKPQATLCRVEGGPVDLVLEGGGVKGIGLVGALDVLEREGFRPENLAGASAGAIVAALYGVGYSAASLRDIIHKLDFSKFEDAGWRQHLAAIGGTVGVLRRQGFNRGHAFLDWMTARLAEKGVRTFGDLKRQDTRGAGQRVFSHHLQVIVSDLTQRRLLVLPRDAAEIGIDPDRLEVARSWSSPSRGSPRARTRRASRGHRVGSGRWSTTARA